MLKAFPGRADMDRMPEALEVPQPSPGRPPVAGPGPQPEAAARHRCGLSRPLLGRLGQESGFTLVEVMVAMTVGLVLAGALMSFLVSSIHAGDGIASRTFSATRVEAGFAQLTRDLREAQNLPDSAGALSNGVKVNDDSPVVITYTTGSTAHFTASFYLPNTTTSTLPGSAVTWTCTAASGTVYGTCTRAVGSVTATEITGVTSATITPMASDGTTIATATLTGPAGSQLATPPGSPPQYPSSVSVALNVVPISANDKTDTRAVTGSTAITLQAGVNLRAWS